MKKLILGLILFTAIPVQARQVVFDIPERDIAIMEHDVQDAMAWMTNAWNGKVNKCKARLAIKEKERLIKEANGQPIIVGNEDALADQALARPDYLDRKEQDSLEVIRSEAEAARAELEAAGVKR